MATRNDIYNYSGSSFEDMVDLVLKLELDNQNLQDAYNELLEEKGSLQDQVIYLMERQE